MSYFRHPKTHQEMAVNADPEIKHLVRAKRHPVNIPDSWWDLYKCPDQDTKRQIRRSQNNFRQSLKNFSHDL